MLDGLPEVLNLDTLSKHLGISKQLLATQIRNGHLQCRRLGRRVLVTKADAQAWLDDAPRTLGTRSHVR
jgi:excisionase family DNA binding protein